tara:strand:- start:8877 stop:9254 length:378 start_codon:yes stop_codon:yes gene_type:complete
MPHYITYWTAPVDIIARREGWLAVEGPLQAIHILNGDWPEKESEHYKKALRECDHASRLQGGLASSRELFVAAALAAGALIPRQTRRGRPAASGAVLSPRPSTDGRSPHEIAARETGVMETAVGV